MEPRRVSRARACAPARARGLDEQQRAAIGDQAAAGQQQRRQARYKQPRAPVKSPQPFHTRQTCMRRHFSGPPRSAAAGHGKHRQGTGRRTRQLHGCSGRGDGVSDPLARD